jgi:HD-GYP domain-containing protein (c-di-GMP phosphodiesterase class II)
MAFAVAREEIIHQSGKHFDPEVVSAFLSIFEGKWNEIRNGRDVYVSWDTPGVELVPPTQIDNATQSLQAGA